MTSRILLSVTLLSVSVRVVLPYLIGSGKRYRYSFCRFSKDPSCPPLGKGEGFFSPPAKGEARVLSPFSKGELVGVGPPWLIRQIRHGKANCSGTFLPRCRISLLPHRQCISAIRRPHFRQIFPVTFRPAEALYLVLKGFAFWCFRVAKLFGREYSITVSWFGVRTEPKHSIPASGMIVLTQPSLQPKRVLFYLDNDPVSAFLFIRETSRRG